MFRRDRPAHGVQARALVIEKKVYATSVETSSASIVRYLLRVQFEDGVTIEVTRRAFGSPLSSAAVGDLIPIRYDPDDRGKIEIDKTAFSAEREAAARGRDAEAVERGQRRLEDAGVHPSPTPPPHRGEDSVHLSDRERDLIEDALSEQATTGRLTIEELEGRLDNLARAQTRGEARPLFDGLPASSRPSWLSAPPSDARTDNRVPGTPREARSTGTSDEVLAAEQAWRARDAKLKTDKAAHKQAKASGDKRAELQAFNRLMTSKANEKSARAKLDRLRRERPD